MLSRGASFFLLVLSARHLSTATFGTLSLILVVSGFVLAFGTFGLDVLLLRELTIRKSSATSLIRYVFQLKMALVFVALVIAVFYLARTSASSFPLAATMIMLASLPNAFAETFETQLADRREYVTRAAVSSIPMVAAVAVLLALLPYARNDSARMALIAVAVLAGASVRSQLGWKYSRTHLPRKVVDLERPTTRLNLVKLALPFALIAILGFLYARIDTIFIVSILGSSDLGYYSAAYALYLGLITIMAAMGPILIQRAHELQGSHTRQRTDVYTAAVIGALISVAVIPMSPFIIELVYGESFTKSSSILMILTIALPINYANSVALRQCYSAGLERSLLPVLAGALAITCFANAVALLALGISGAAVATIVTEFALFLGLQGNLRRVRHSGSLAP